MNITNRVEKILWNEGDDSVKHKLVASIDSPLELYSLIVNYNWDDGFNIPMLVANHPCCELGTAIAMFWLSNANEYMATDKAPSNHEREAWGFSNHLTQKILAHHYKIKKVSHDEEFSKIDIYQFEKNSIPELLWMPVLANGS